MLCRLPQRPTTSTMLLSLLDVWLTGLVLLWTTTPSLPPQSSYPTSPCRSVGNKDLKKYEAMVRQCRPLVGDGRFVSVITRLLGSAEDQLVAAQIQKLLKSEAASAHPRSSLSAPQYGFSRPVFHPYADYSRGRGRGSMSRNRCYSCGRWGHFARACPERRQASHNLHPCYPVPAVQSFDP